MFPSVSRAETSSAGFAYSNDSATGQATVTAVWNRVKHIDQVNGKLACLSSRDLLSNKSTFLFPFSDTLQVPISRCVRRSAWLFDMFEFARWIWMLLLCRTIFASFRIFRWIVVRFFIDNVSAAENRLDASTVGFGWRQQSPHIVERDSWCVSSVMWSFDCRLSV